MMKHAWDNYATYAWGKNELRPVSHKGHSASIFGSGNFGATIVDGLDTLYIMGWMDEFNQGRKWIQENLNLTGVVYIVLSLKFLPCEWRIITKLLFLAKQSSELSVFETNIRFVGGLLTLYALTGDVMFRDKASHIAEKLLPAFNTPTGIPHALVNIANGVRLHAIM